MPSAIICLDCNALFTRTQAVRDHGRCPACLPAYIERDRARASKRSDHKPTPRRQATRAFAQSTAWRKVSKHVRDRDGACQHCGTTHSLTVHHIEGIHERPDLAYDPANLVTLCRSCHARESNTSRARATRREHAR